MISFLSSIKSKFFKIIYNISIKTTCIDYEDFKNRVEKYNLDNNKTRINLNDLEPEDKLLEMREAFSLIKEQGDKIVTLLDDHWNCIQNIEAKGIAIIRVTLHVGLGTFRPVQVDDIKEHKMHSEHYFMPKETADLIKQTKANGGRIIAVGTTSCRTLESVATFNGEITECEGYTDIFIYPGYEFKCIDGLITNFHLPESTLIMLVSAFTGYDNTMNAYRTAVEEKYRFFSFGDSMCIL